MSSDFYSFMRNQSFTHFQEWLREVPNVDRLEKLKTDKHGHQLYAMFYQRQKRGLIRIPPELVGTHEQKLIDQVKAQFSHTNKVRISVGTRRTKGGLITHSVTRGILYERAARKRLHVNYDV